MDAESLVRASSVPKINFIWRSGCARNREASPLVVALASTNGLKIVTVRIAAIDKFEFLIYAGIRPHV